MSSTHYVVLRILFVFFFFVWCQKIIATKYCQNIHFHVLISVFFLCLIAVQNSEKVHITVVVDVLRWSEALVVLLPGWNK